MRFDHALRDLRHVSFAVDGIVGGHYQFHRDTDPNTRAEAAFDDLRSALAQ